MNEKTRKYIDGLTLDQLLSKWRFAPIGDPMLQGETGDYFSKVMSEKRKAAGDGAWTAASKSVGWD